MVPGCPWLRDDMTGMGSKEKQAWSVGDGAPMGQLYSVVNKIG